MNLFKKIVSGLFTLLLLAGSFSPFYKAAEAQWIVEDPINIIQGTISAIEDVDIGLKEFVLDGLAKSLANAVATQMKNSIVSWITSGFEGNPAFVTDLEGFMLDVGDTVAADFIQTLDSETQSLICSPFRADIKYSLTIEYYSSTSGRPTDRCSLDEIFENAERLDKFLDGSFSEGGWQGWFNLTVKPHNNPYGSYLQAHDELSVRLSGQKAKERDELEWASGFLSKKVCGDEVFSYVRDSGLGADEYTTLEGSEDDPVGADGVSEGDGGCIVVTPGQAIEDTLSDVLGSDLRELELVDEFNEIVAALVAQLAKEVITGAQGLLGTSKPQGGNRQSFLERVGVEQQQQNQSSTAAAAEKRVTQAIESETQYKEIKLNSLSRVAQADVALKSLEACLATKTVLDPLYTSSFAFASTTRAFITSTAAALNTSVSTSNTAQTTLTQLEADVKAAPNTQALQSILTTLQNLETNNSVHDGQDVIVAVRENADNSKKMEVTIAEIGTRLSTCAI